MRRLIPRKDLVEAWRDLEDNAKDLAKRLSGKEAATPSRTWKLLSDARPEMILFLAVTARQQAVAQKIKNFFTKWRQVQQKIPLAGDDGAAHHAAVAGVSEDCAGRIHAAAGRQAAFADRDPEVPEAAGPTAASTASTTSAQARTGSEGRRRGRRRGGSRGGCGFSRGEEEGERASPEACGPGCGQSGSLEACRSAETREGQGEENADGSAGQSLSQKR